VHQVFSLFQIHLTTLIKNKFEFLWQKSIAPSEIDRMSYWEFEEYIKIMNERNEEENKKQKAQNEQQQEQQQGMMSNMPKMPNMSNFKPPSLPKM
jgi:hypothetical protein